MIYLILILVWYFIGSIGGIFIASKINPKITNGDTVFIFTVGGISGILTVIIGLTHLPKSEWWDNKFEINLKNKHGIEKTKNWS